MTILALSERLRGHWAIDAVSQTEQGARILQRLEQSIPDAVESEAERDAIQAVALACELTAVEWLDGGGVEAAGEACRWLFYLDRLRRPPGWKQPHEHVATLLKSAAVGLCAGERAAVRSGLEEAAWTTPEDPGDWEQRLLCSLAGAWKAILSRSSSPAPPATAGLRARQRAEEKRLIKATPEDERRALGLRLVGLYHAIYASEQLAQGDPAGKAEHHLQMSARGFEQAGPPAIWLAGAMRWLQAAATEVRS